MAGVDTILRIIGAFLFVFILIFVAWVGVTLTDPIFNSLTGPPDALGWGDGSTFLLFMGYGLAGLGLTTIIWLIVAEIRDDVRQEQRPPRF